MKDRLENILSQKLRDVTVESESSDWTRIERSLGLAPKKSVPLGRYLAVAASLVIMLGLGFYLFTNEQAIEPTITPLVATTSPHVIENNTPGEPVTDTPNTAIEAVRQLKNAIDEANAKSTLLTAAVWGEGAQVAEPPVVGTEPTPGVNRGAQSNAAGQQRQPATTNNQRYAQENAAGNNYQSNSSYYANAGLPTRRNSRRNSGSNWALALFTDGSGRLRSGSRGDDIAMQQHFDPTQDGFTKDLSLLMTNDGALAEVDLTKTAMTKVEQADMKHRMPLSFGLTVRKNLTDRWGIETGLIYTYHLAKSELSTSYNYRLKQQLHYLGVPVAFTYTPLRTNNFELYARGGATMDFNIASKVTQTTQSNGTGAYTSAPQITRFTQDGVQWSVSANVGVMYNISPIVGIYFEPGVSHFFDNSHQPDSYWKKHPTNFNVKLGVRTSF